MDHDDHEMEKFPIAYSIDNLILMHRDAHFGGNFDIMLDYYDKNGRGTSAEFDIDRIQELADTQEAQGNDLSPLMLSGAEAERVAYSRKLYKDLRELCESHNKKNPIPKLIAELILSEDEEIPKAIEAVTAEKSAIVPALIQLLRNEDFYDSLAPGYGLAPTLAAECLGKIGDKRAIFSLFEAVGSGDFFSEGNLLDALKAIGDPAKEFLLKVLHGKPLTADNEKAAIALLSFKEYPQVASTCLQMLKELDMKKYMPLATYLVLVCEGISSQDEQKELLDLAKKPETPKNIQQDIITVSHSWPSG